MSNYYSGLKVQVENVDEVIETLDSTKKLDLSTTLEQVGQLVQGYATSLAPIDMGQLRASIKSELDSPNSVVIYTNVFYAPMIEFGTGIFAGEPPALHNEFIGTGRQTPWRYYYTGNKLSDKEKEWKQKHPDEEGVWRTTKGMRAKPFLQPALDDHITEIIDYIRDEAKRQMKE